MAKIGKVSVCDSCRNAELCKYANRLKQDTDDIVEYANTKSELLTINFLCKYYEDRSKIQWISNKDSKPYADLDNGILRK